MTRALKTILTGALAVLLAMSAALPAAATEVSPLAREMTAQMQVAKQTSRDLINTADTLHAITRSGDHSWQSHSTYLNTVREHVNELGEMLVTLEDLSQHGTLSQQAALQSIRPRLVETAGALTNAIELLNDRRHNVYFSEYRDAVQTVSEQSNSLHETLEAVLKYEAARDRLVNLDLWLAT